MITLWNPPPGNQASGSDYAARHCGSDSRTVLGDKGFATPRQNRARPCLLPIWRNCLSAPATCPLDISILGFPLLS